MIYVENLTKRYDTTTALDHVSFEVQKGEVVGLLGPNGAGKTTSMKILTGFLPATEGRASLAGFDVTTQSLDVRRNVGYLPEANPLYEDMEVVEFLDFIGRLRGLDAAARWQRIQEVTTLCGLREVVGKDIGHLSKGYKQRVGIAQAILHNPPILIMDEPTSWLDPNQIREIRGLINQLKQEKTLILSTHILSEVQASCDRVLIIHQGKIVADSPVQELQGLAGGGETVRVTLKTSDDPERALKTIPGVQDVSESARDNGTRSFVLSCSVGSDIREAVFQTAVNHSWTLLELHRERVNLEEIFRKLTASS